MDHLRDHDKQSNKLINEPSPYLQQHAENPVDWFPWGNEAFEKAEREDKLILVSIGYSACHWCHVMEHESFSDHEVAALMNEHFVSIKVDREERPDVDSIYMDAVQLITGSGGWPLNCFALPDGRPIYGGTYFPKEQWKQILVSLSNSYRQEPEKLKQQAEHVKEGVQNLQLLKPVQSIAPFQQDDLEEPMEEIKDHFDNKFGGIEGAPKFPMPVLYQFLLKYHFHTGDQSVLDHVVLTLQSMAKGGIYDHLGGGFSRYATDDQWLVPHFEKMLYDNALLASLYSQAYLYTKQDELRRTVIETLEFIKNNMMSGEHMFYSSIDADSIEGEGAYYTWHKEEIDFTLHKTSDIINDYFGVQRNGHWNDRNILYINTPIEELAEKYNKDENEVEEIINQGKKLLLQRRKKKPAPSTDKKVITSWNALAVKAFIDGYKATGRKEYLRIALNSAEYLVGYQVQSNYKINRIRINGKSSVKGFLDDYALLGQVLIELYQITFDAKWVDWAYKITNYALRNFSDPNNELLNYMVVPDKQLISNKKELIDAVLPASNSVFAQNLFILGQYFYTDSYLERARKMLGTVKDVISRSPLYFSNWLSLMIWYVYPPYEVSIVGRKAEEYRDRFEKLYHPGVILAGGSHEGNLPILKNRFKLGKTQIFICRGQVCREPLNNVDEAIQQIV